MRKLICLILVASGFALTGCASVGHTAYDADADIDKAKVAAIEHVARQRGVGVIWHHYPQKRGSGGAQ